MSRSVAETVLKGAVAGLAAGIPQAAVGKIEERLFLPRSEDSNIAPRLVDRLGRKVGYDTEPAEEWALGTVFHFAYGAVWGGLYGLAAERFKPEPLVGGALLGTLIYGITFPRWGGAVRLGVERPPGVRTARMTAVAWSVALSFGVGTSLLYDAMTRRDGGDGELGSRGSREGRPRSRPKPQRSDSAVSAA